ncbi:hypothetical protein KKE60_08170 [Patescibacteria group bacterium]|uniref:Uncharacterized protein n=1 Tax=viral metagenome TaxID=1070528 RepID=A0A6M3M643_9ZZZZ|nr:hypothetical protein [Patescibacteria group bacterium]
MSLNLNVISFQDPLRSKPIRENFTDIQNAVNTQDAAVAALTTAASGSETVAARDYHTDLKDRLRSTSKGVGSVIITGGEVTEQGTPDMTVAVAAGEALVNGVACKWAAADSGTITAPVTHPRIDVVVINSDNTLSIVAGSEAATPVKPSLAVSQRPLATITLATSTTSITTSLITDWRYRGCITNAGAWDYDISIEADQINEITSGAGVTIDGLLIKDSAITTLKKNGYTYTLPATKNTSFYSVEKIFTFENITTATNFLTITTDLTAGDYGHAVISWTAAGYAPENASVQVAVASLLITNGTQGNMLGATELYTSKPPVIAGTTASNVTTLSIAKNAADTSFYGSLSIKIQFSSYVGDIVWTVADV